MKCIFALLIAVVVLMAGCGEAPDPINESGETEEIKKESEYPPVTGFSATDDIPINVEIITDEILNMYDSFHEFSDPHDKNYYYNQKIIFIVTEGLRDFKYIEIRFKEDWSSESNSQLFYVHDVLYSIDELLLEKPFITTWVEVGLMPHRGISYTDKNNETKILYIAQSGYDGSLILSDLF